MSYNVFLIACSLQTIELIALGPRQYNYENTTP